MRISVVMITYMHENQIYDAINGVLMQECDFEIELIIANDCSPDNTDLIVNKVIKEHPNSSWINYTRHEENKGMKSNFIWAIKQCTGNYIALCEGDDYWTDPLKLNKQVTFLENSPDYVMCFHKVDILKLNGKIVPDFITILPENFHKRDVLLKNSNYIHTPSVLFRNIVNIFPEIYKLSPEGDYIFYILLTKYGKIGYLNENMAVYRYGHGFISRNKNNYFKNIALVNMISLKIVEEEEDIELLLNKNVDFIEHSLKNLPISLILLNIKKLPARFIKNYINGNIIVIFF
jgi:glycosyltransferase involved in cell wall biosynthesis